MTLPYSCAGCTRRWGGFRTAHCAACHTTFSTVYNFDEHRKGGVCNLPERVGLKWTMRGHGGNEYQVWGRPMDDDARARMERLKDGD